MIGSAMLEQEQEHNDDSVGAILTLFDWPDQLVASTASGPKLKQTIATTFEDSERKVLQKLCTTKRFDKPLKRNQD